MTDAKGAARDGDRVAADAVALGEALWEEARAQADIRDAFPLPAVTEAEYRAATRKGSSMGWDAFATEDGKAVILGGPTGEYAAAAQALRTQGVRVVDGLLKEGGLDVSDCGRALALATLSDFYSEEAWTSDDVRVKATCVNWDRARAAGCEEWAVRSAQAFLETAARLGHGVRFSW